MSEKRVLRTDRVLAAIGGCSDQTQIIAFDLLVLADDEGRMFGSAPLIVAEIAGILKHKCVPTAAVIAAAIEELARCRFLQLYERRGVSYLAVIDFHAYFPRIRRPHPSHWPKPPPLPAAPAPLPAPAPEVEEEAEQLPLFGRPQAERERRAAIACRASRAAQAKEQ